MDEHDTLIEGIQKHVMNSCDSVTINNDPYSHAIVDNFFPLDIYRKIDNFFPDIHHSEFDHLAIKKDQKRYMRSFFSQSTKSSIEHILDDVFDERLLKYFLKKYNIPYNSNYGWAAHYAWDYGVEGCCVSRPHVDVKAKILSLVYYIPAVSIVKGKVEIQKMPGTDILIQNENGTFFEYASVEAKKNRCFIFKPNDKSWHAVKETKTPRRTITAFIADRYLNELERIPFKYIKLSDTIATYNKEKHEQECS